MQNPNQPPPPTTTKKDNRTTTLYCLLATSVFSLISVLSLSSSTSSSQPNPHTRPDPFLFPNRQPQTQNTNNHQHHRLLIINHHSPNDPSPPPPTPPSVAYLISGSAKDTGRILRLLFAIYHPKNQYLLHLDLSAPQSERDSLALKIESIPVFKAAQNVNVIGKADFAYPKGSSSLSSTLHGASILLRISRNWDWFINLSAADYPMITQDDLLHILSYLPKDLNFVNHTSYIGWRESRKLRPIIVDPGLYLSEKDEIFHATQKRELPDAYQLFMGSSSSILSRKFIEFCIVGTENLPRTLLMYLANTPSALPIYFPTLLCNSRRFNSTILNHGLQYIPYNGKQDPQPLNLSDFKILTRSGVAFAAPFQRDDPVLDRIDRKILGRSPGEPVPGGWCLGELGNNSCSVWGDADILRPGLGAKRLAKRIVKLLSNGDFHSHSCVIE